MNNRFGLTKGRYNQMMEYYENDEESVEEVVNAWGAEKCNKGYDIFDYDGTGMLDIEAIGDVCAFDDYGAALSAEADGIKIIPVEELPDTMPEDMRFWGWVDTPENRANIEAYCGKVSEPKKSKHNIER